MLIILRYAISGIVLNALSFLSYIILLKFFNFSPTLSVTIQFPLILLIYFFSQSIFVFKKKINTKSIIIFFINILFLYLFNILLLFIFVTKYSFEPIVTQLFIMLSLVVINFIIQKKIIFK